MLMLQLLDVTIRKRGTTVFAVVLTMASLSSQTVAQNANRATQRSNRITQQMDAAEMVAVTGSVHPLTRRATDLGAVNSLMPLNSLTLNIGLSTSQQKEMDALLEAQQNPSSPLYRQWLTQEAYGARFGLTEADLNAVTGWLASQGFTVGSVSKSRNAIHFSGKTWQVESAFHTQLHRFQVDGKEHFANTTELRVPAAIGSVILNVRGLNSFRLKPNLRKREKPAYTVEFSVTDIENFLSPADWAAIYEVSPIYAQSCGSTPCDGTGMHVGVVGQTFAPLSDITNFRTAAGLTVSANNVHYVCIDPNAAHCTGSFAISTAGDLAEADMDIEWAGGIAKNATVDFVYAPYSDACSNSKCTTGVVDPVTGNYYDVFDALQHAIEDYTVPATGKVLPVISMSYGDCEESFAGQSSYVRWVTTIGQEANSQGQTLVVSSGDSGAFGCDSGNYPAELGVSVGIPADSPHYTAVGGTTLSGDSNSPSTYWNETPYLVNSALRYIAESVWNDTSSSAGLSASGGGVSLYYPQPTWQNGLISGQTSGRMVPDVAFAASPNHDGYMICSQDDATAKYGTDCATGFVSSQGYIDNVYGGTSAGAPSFAGMLTLLAQKHGAGLGNINPTLYNLASSPTTYAAIFHDITSGDNVVSCTVASSDQGCVGGQFGWEATTGYDLATGLGSINGFQFFTVTAAPAYTINPSASAITISAGSNGIVTLNLASTNYAGTVSLQVSINSSSVFASATSVTLTSGGNGTSTVTISPSANAANHAPAIPWKSCGAVVFCAVLLGAPFTRRRRHVIAVLLTALAVSLAGVVAACGGGGGGSMSPQPRTYAVTVTPTGTWVVTNPAPVVITVTVP
jgi:subtilase family serine protease